jgi:hypothetical protein
MSAITQLITYDQNLNSNKRPYGIICREASEEYASLRKSLFLAEEVCKAVETAIELHLIEPTTLISKNLSTWKNSL